MAVAGSAYPTFTAKVKAGRLTCGHNVTINGLSYMSAEEAIFALATKPTEEVRVGAMGLSKGNIAKYWNQYINSKPEPINGTTAIVYWLILYNQQLAIIYLNGVHDQDRITKTRPLVSGLPDNPESYNYHLTGIILPSATTDQLNQARELADVLLAKGD